MLPLMIKRPIQWIDVEDNEFNYDKFKSFWFYFKLLVLIQVNLTWTAMRSYSIDYLQYVVSHGNSEKKTSRILENLKKRERNCFLMTPQWNAFGNSISKNKFYYIRKMCHQRFSFHVANLRHFICLSMVLNITCG